MNELVEQYLAGSGKLRAAVAGVAESDFHWQPPAEAKLGLWTIQQVVVHIVDSDLVGIDRMKRIIAEPNPLLTAYNETLFSQRLSYEKQAIDDVVALLELSRKVFGVALSNAKPEDFARTGIHTETGKVTLADELKKYIWHLDHHLGFIAKKRAYLKK